MFSGSPGHRRDARGHVHEQNHIVSSAHLRGPIENVVDEQTPLAHGSHSERIWFRSHPSTAIRKVSSICCLRTPWPQPISSVLPGLILCDCIWRGESQSATASRSDPRLPSRTTHRPSRQLWPATETLTGSLKWSLFPRILREGCVSGKL